MQTKKPYLTEAEEEKMLLRLMEEGKRQGRMTKKEQEALVLWLYERASIKR